MSDAGASSLGKPEQRWKRRKAERPAELLDAALEVFAAQGLERGTLDEVARRAGVTRGTIFLYYENKRELFRALVRAYAPGGLELTSALEALNGRPASEQLSEALRLVGDAMLGQKSRAVLRLVAAEARNHPCVAREFRALLTDNLTLPLAKIIERGTAEGAFCKVDAVAVARLGLSVPFAIAFTTTATPAVIFDDPNIYDRTLAMSARVLVCGLTRCPDKPIDVGVPAAAPRDEYADVAGDGRRRSKSKRSGELLEAACDVFGEKGFHQTTIEDVALRAGVTRATVYLHFKNKSEIFDAVADLAYAHRNEIARRVAACADRPAPLQLREAIDAFYSTLKARHLQNLYRVALWEPTIALGSRPERTAQQRFPVILAFAALMRGLMESGKVETADPIITALAIGAPVMAMAEWLAIWDGDGPDEHQFPFVVEATAEVHKELVVRALHTAEPGCVGGLE